MPDTPVAIKDIRISVQPLWGREHRIPLMKLFTEAAQAVEKPLAITLQQDVGNENGPENRFIDHPLNGRRLPMSGNCDPVEQEIRTADTENSGFAIQCFDDSRQR
jgi:hypothetical protein